MNPSQIVKLLDKRAVELDAAIGEFEGAAGVYALLDDDLNVLYVGQSGNVGQRLIRHRRDKKKKSVTHCFMVGVPDADERLIQETIWIALLRPPLNNAILLRVHAGKLTEIRYRRRKR